MSKITHSTMMRGRDIPASNEDSEMYIIDDMSNATEAMIEDDLDKRLSAFEASSDAPPTINTPLVDIPVAFNIPKRPNVAEQKKALESLIFMGRHSKEIEIANHKFEISTLSHKEHNSIVRELMKFGEAADLFTIRILTLAYAIKSIDGIPIDDIDIGEEFESNYEKRTTIIDNLQLALVERLNNAYEKMVDEAESVIYHEAIKN